MKTDCTDRIFRPLIMIAGLLLLGLTACGGEEEPAGPPPTFDFSLQVEASTPEGDPVPRVPVKVDDRLVGFTDADGLFEATINEAAGTMVRLSVDETEDYAIISDQRSVESTLRLTEGIDGQARGIPTTLRVQLQSVVYDYFAWIDVDCDDKLDDEHCKGLSVLLNGDAIAETDTRGFAHFAFKSSPSETMEVTVATPEPTEDGPTFEPANPTYELELAAEPVIFHLAESFTDPTVEDRPRRRPRPRPRPRPRQPEPEPEEPAAEEEDDDDGALCIFGDC